MPTKNAMGRRAPRQRLTVDARREQLLGLGMELFSTRAYEEVWIEEIAERAGVSRGLLYHYFPTKRDFYVAVARAAVEDVREVRTLREERDILKKAAAWFARETGSIPPKDSSS